MSQRKATRTKKLCYFDEAEVGSSPLPKLIHEIASSYLLAVAFPGEKPLMDTQFCATNPNYALGPLNIRYSAIWYPKKWYA